MKNYDQYLVYKKPSWAPPAWLFGPVWTVLYLIIAVSFGFIGYAYLHQEIPFLVMLPFALNLVFNIAFTPIQFGLRNLALGALDILLVLATLVWALGAAYPFAAWVTYANIPYLAWVCFATTLEMTVLALNRRS